MGLKIDKWSVFYKIIKSISIILVLEDKWIDRRKYFLENFGFGLFGSGKFEIFINLIGYVCGLGNW